MDNISCSEKTSSNISENILAVYQERICDIEKVYEKWDNLKKSKSYLTYEEKVRIISKLYEIFHGIIIEATLLTIKNKGV